RFLEQATFKQVEFRLLFNKLKSRVIHDPHYLAPRNFVSGQALAKLSLLASAIIASLTPAFAEEANNSANRSEPLEVITVKGDFVRQNLQKTPASVAVITESIMQQRNAQHLEDILNVSANINFSSGASRARFFQIRGIGERSQFVDSVNPSVGITIDGIDYSGIGTIATLFDIDQVEIFRGPQGTRFGANAMAGMINLQGHEADGEQSGKVQASYGNYNSSQIAAAHGSQISETLFYRAAVQKLKSDGFIENRHLNRDDSNGTDELGGRLNLRWLASEDWQLDLASHYFDLDNGYDSFSLDSNRDTLSDQPGFDRQRTRAFALNGQYSGFTQADMTFNISHNNSDLAYGYDEDWTYTGFHPWEYSSFDHYFREHQNNTLDVRFNSKEHSEHQWTFGVYRQQKDVALERRATYGFTPIFSSQFDTDNIAVYGQFEVALNDKTTLTTGLRVEEHSAEYRDSLASLTNNSAATGQDIKDVMWGGKLSLSYQASDNTLFYTSLSRGYKAGGVNGEAIAKALLDGTDTTADFLQQRTAFEPETLQNIELGVKGSSDDGKLMLRFAAFYSDRDKMQLKGNVTEQATGGDDAPIFVGYIENAASGNNFGFETELTYQANEATELFASVGWLKTEVENFVAQDGTNMDGREQAHAPQYQYNLGLQYDFNQNWFIHVSAEGKDEFYFSMSHNAQSKKFNLLNLSLGYQADDWDITVWGRNILGKDYAVRGFKFGNDPRDGYESHTYTQMGEPARFGATMRYHF
ncbi:MAG: iron complex outermembrane receptor protein, partial [Phenylobacterium sp.]